MHMVLVATVACLGAAQPNIEAILAAQPQAKPSPAIEPGWRPGEVDFLQLDGAAEYIRRYATNPPSDAELDHEKSIVIDRSRVRNPFYTAGVVGDIVVVEGSGGITYTQACPAPRQSSTCTYFNDNAIVDVANEVLGHSGDEHDMLVIFTTFAQTDAYYAAYYLPLKNDTAGLGACDFDHGETHGCLFDNVSGLRLQGLIYMSSVSSWQEQEININGRALPLDDVDAMVYDGVGHETLHRWGTALRFVDQRSGAVSKEMLGESMVHWNPSVDASGSLHYGFDWEDQGNGTFELLDIDQKLSDMDLYAMGVMAASDVRPWFMIENAQSDELATLLRAVGYSGFDGKLNGAGLYIPTLPVETLDWLIERNYPSMGEHVTATGSRFDIDIDDVIAAEGPRVPAFGAAQRAFRQAWVVVTGPTQTMSQAGSAVAEVDKVRRNFERYFNQLSDGRARICTRLHGECAAPLVEPRGIRFDDSLANNNGVVDFDESIDFFASAANHGDEAAEDVVVSAKALDKGLSVDRAEAELGSIAVNSSQEAPESLLVYVDKDAECGVPLRLEVQFNGTNTAPQKFVEPILPGFKVLWSSDFEDGDNGWTFNPGGEDDATAGIFERGNTREQWASGVCVTPAWQTTGAGQYALFTDSVADGEFVAHDVDGGFTSVLSPAIELKDSKDPYLSYRYWHVASSADGVQRQVRDNRLLIELSTDGKGFVEAVSHVDNTAAWGHGLLRVRDILEAVPEKLYVRITQFDDGDDDVVEAGIDDVRVYEPVGRCAPEGCGCSAKQVDSNAPWFAAVVALMLWRRRSR